MNADPMRIDAHHSSVDFLARAYLGNVGSIPRARLVREMAALPGTESSGGLMGALLGRLGDPVRGQTAWRYARSSPAAFAALLDDVIATKEAAGA